LLERETPSRERKTLAERKLDRTAEHRNLGAVLLGGTMKKREGEAVYRSLIRESKKDLLVRFGDGREMQDRMPTLFSRLGRLKTKTSCVA